MGKKKTDESGANARAKDAPKDVKKLSVSAMLANMDQKPDKAKKGSSSSSSTSSKPKSKSRAAPKLSSYTDDIDLPPSDDEDNDYASEEGLQENDVHKQPARHQRTDAKPLDISITDKELKKREKKDMLAAQAAEQAKQVASS